LGRGSEKREFLHWRKTASSRALETEGFLRRSLPRRLVLRLNSSNIDNTVSDTKSTLPGAFCYTYPVPFHSQEGVDMTPFKRIPLSRARRMLDRRHPTGPSVESLERHLKDHIGNGKDMAELRAAELHSVGLPATISEMNKRVVKKRKPAAMTAANKRK
jgi:hypothetical protein